MSTNDRQIGGDHYLKQEIQPWDAILAWGLNFLEGSVVKYIVRWRHKDGISDLRKAQHYLEKLIVVEEARLERELRESTDATKRSSKTSKSTK